MHNTLSMGMAAMWVVLAIVSVRALIEVEYPRPSWAKRCLILLAVVSGITGILRAVVVSGNPAFLTRTQLIFFQGLGLMFQGFSLGLLIALGAAGHFSTKGPRK